ncbi:MBL fold metallo-hydrolase [Phaeobacter sp. QD34_3]|uniref:MBL fold metallo-hydrolase n=1 Tax=unclassified Phaeobacter TaxID=2621772 RepID=UPI00237F4A75|nr:MULTISPECIES: MBL fold metallo-hydrolase [unclassified Phaeobacter]MDE4131484.1 MBL fold metallo-hydrolase [Phaeobacter sp. QD34_3]MDE4135427.1 MBL fold metallo-hydrolase [Phaeobacter sp. QD34_24]
MQAPDDFNPAPGIAEELQPGVRRILAPNPSPMTYRGTNTYLVGQKDLAVIDPGPVIEDHLQAILSAVAPGQRITHVIVTHAHVDHSPLAAELARRCDVPVYGFGPAEAGRSPVMQELVRQGMSDGGEGIDTEFTPDVTVADGDRITGDDWTLEVLHTPGHLGNHIALALGDACFTADHVMGWASSLVSPPDGDLTDFMASCRKLRARDWRVFYPGHGAPIDDPAGRLDWLIEHRMAREGAILDALAAGPATPRELARRIYTETPAALLMAAERNVLAHLIDLMGKSRVEPEQELSPTVAFRLQT